MHAQSVATRRWTLDGIEAVGLGRHLARGGVPISPGCAFRPSRTVGALLGSLLRERVVIRVDVLRQMERRPMKTKVSLNSVSFVGLGGMARPGHSALPRPATW